MDLARYVVEAVVLEGRTYREVARSHGVSKSYVGKLVGWFRDGGYEAIAPRSRTAKRIPHRTPDELEDQMVALRKELTELGVDAGAATTHYHLALRHDRMPSISTIWPVLRRRGFVSPQPQAAPELLGAIRGEAAERVLAVRRHPLAPRRLERGRNRELHRRPLASGGGVSGLDHGDGTGGAGGVPGSRCTLGFPAALLTDNGCVYTTWHRGGPNVMQTELLALGIDYRHSRPYHPQTCGKVERFHQTMKAYLARQ